MVQLVPGAGRHTVEQHTELGLAGLAEQELPHVKIHH